MLLPLLQNNLLTVTGAYNLNFEPGSYSITGNDVTIQRSLILNFEPGSYSISGNDVTLDRSLLLNFEPGDYSITGSDVALSFSSGIVEPEIFGSGSQLARRKKRQYSLEEWEKWIENKELTKDHIESIEDGILPVELKQIAVEAVKESVGASFINDEREHLLAAMEAWETYNEAYKQAYKETYISETVKQRWLDDLRKEKRKRSIALLLLH